MSVIGGNLSGCFDLPDLLVLCRRSWVVAFRAFFDCLLFCRFLLAAILSSLLTIRYDIAKREFRPLGISSAPPKKLSLPSDGEWIRIFFIFSIGQSKGKAEKWSYYTYVRLITRIHHPRAGEFCAALISLTEEVPSKTRDGTREVHGRSDFECPKRVAV